MAPPCNVAVNAPTDSYFDGPDFRAQCIFDTIMSILDELTASGSAGPFGNQINRPLVALAFEIFLENPMKDRVLRRHEREQRDARSQFHVVRRSENVMRRASLDGERGFSAFDETRTEDRMLQIRARFVKAADRVVPRGWAQTKTGELRKDVPHPMRAFPAGRDLFERARVVRFLGTDETFQIKRIGAI